MKKAKAPLWKPPRVQPGEPVPILKVGSDGWVRPVKSAPPLRDDRPWSEKEVCRFVGRSRATIRRWAQHDGFPKPRPLGPNSVAWSEREVRAWWERKKAMRRGEGE